MEFKVETIVSSVKELAKEGKEKEKKLMELCTYRKQLQKKLENTMKHITVNSKWNKSFETMKCTEQKMMELESLINHFETVTNKKRQIIQNINNNLTDEEFLMQQELIQFEKKITFLTENFRSAVHVYRKESLEEDLLRNNSTKSILLEKIQENQLLLKILHGKLRDYKLRANETDEVIIDDDSKGIIRDLCKNECAICKVKYQKKLKEHKSLLMEKEGLQEKLKDLKSQLQ